MKKQNDNFNIKSHKEILELIDEIKEYEYLIPDYEIIQPEKIEEEIIEVDYNESSELNPLPIKKESRKNFFRKKILSNGDKIKPATFKFRYDENGELVSSDFINYKFKTKNQKNKKFILNKLKSLRKSRKENKSEGKKEKNSKKSKLKKGLGRIGKLKRVIPNKDKKSE